MINGYAGSVLFVDLTSGRLYQQAISKEILQDFVGGAGLGVRVIYERQSPQANPVDKQNILGFVTGPLTATGAPMSSRCTVVAKSPLTCTLGEANFGGAFGTELKRAGYDGVFFTGVSPKPVYLVIRQDRAELREADRLWGKDTCETAELIQGQVGDKKCCQSAEWDTF